MSGFTQNTRADPTGRADHPTLGEQVGPLSASSRVKVTGPGTLMREPFSPLPGVFLSGLEESACPIPSFLPACPANASPPLSSLP